MENAFRTRLFLKESFKGRWNTARVKLHLQDGIEVGMRRKGVKVNSRTSMGDGKFKTLDLLEAAFLEIYEIYHKKERR